MSDLSHLEELLPLLPEAVKKTRFGDSLKLIGPEIADAATRAADAKALIDIAQATLYVTNEQRRERLEDLVDWCSLTAQKLEAAADDSTLRIAKENYSGFKGAQNSLKQAIGEHWDSTRAKTFDPLGSYGEILALVPGLDTLAKDFGACARNAKAVTMSRGPQALRDHIIAMQAEFDRLQRGRAAQVQDPSVGQFLNAIADGRATVDDLTEAVLAWLRQHNATARFRITPSAS